MGWVEPVRLLDQRHAPGQELEGLQRRKVDLVLRRSGVQHPGDHLAFVGSPIPEGDLTRAHPDL
eukprot:566790-Pyramimonas_sp.AAC.1